MHVLLDLLDFFLTTWVKIMNCCPHWKFIDLTYECYANSSFLGLGIRYRSSWFNLWTYFLFLLTLYIYCVTVLLEYFDHTVYSCCLSWKSCIISLTRMLYTVYRYMFQHTPYRLPVYDHFVCSWNSPGNQSLVPICYIKFVQYIKWLLRWCTYFNC